MPYQVDLTVTNPDGQQATVRAVFTFTEAPRITDLTPREGSELGGTTVTIIGANFQPGAEVTFGSRAATNVQVSSDGTRVTCVTPSMV